MEDYAAATAQYQCPTVTGCHRAARGPNIGDRTFYRSEQPKMDTVRPTIAKSLF